MAVRGWFGRGVLAGLVALAWSWSAALAAPAPAPQELREADAQTLMGIAGAAQRNDCKTVLRLGNRLVERSAAALPGEALSALYGMLAGCEIAAGMKENAYRDVLRGTAIEESDATLWTLRLSIELEAKHSEAAAATVAAMAQGHGAALNAAPMLAIHELLRMLKDEGKIAARTAVLRLLASDAYAPGEMFGSNDAFKMLYAQALLAAGDKDGALKVAATLETPETIARASVDPDLRAAVGKADVRAAAEAMLARHREAAARHPERLSAFTFAAGDLRQLGRPGEAAKLLEGVTLPKAQPDDASMSDAINWYWDGLARSYDALGRYDDAAAAFRKGIAAGEQGDPNVSQLINLADTQLEAGKAEEALKTLALHDFSEKGASPYGVMEYRYARACALSLAGRGAQAAADVAWLKAHEKDDRRAVTDLFLCMGDMDAAAASLVGRLGDPETRADTLIELADYDPPPVPVTTDRVAANREKVRARPDVQAALAKAGGTPRFHLQRGEI
jgi:tetratricopeptide (TPR) repeat protein